MKIYRTDAGDVVIRDEKSLPPSNGEKGANWWYDRMSRTDGRLGKRMMVMKIVGYGRNEES